VKQTLNAFRGGKKKMIEKKLFGHGCMLLLLFHVTMKLGSNDEDV